MPYSADISINNPTLLLLLINQSGSMGETSDQPDRTKADMLADVVNRILRHLAMRCSNAEGVQDFFDVCLMGYGQKLGSAFSGSLSARESVSISDVWRMPFRMEAGVSEEYDGGFGIISRKTGIPVWFDPIAEGGRPMRNAFAQVNTVVEKWLGHHPHSFPPVVIHVTDGESTDGDPSNLMKGTTDLRSSDGNVLLFNLHISSDTPSTSVTFPNSDTSLPNGYAKNLFHSSSPLPESMRMIAQSQYGINLPHEARGCLFNAPMSLVTKTLEIGTRHDHLR